MRGLDRRNRLVERLVHKTQDGTLGKPTPYNGADELIVLGDYNQQQSNALSSLGKAILGTALGLGVLGGGAGAAMLGYKALTADPATTTQVQSQPIQQPIQQPVNTTNNITRGFTLEFPK